MQYGVENEKHFEKQVSFDQHSWGLFENEIVTLYGGDTPFRPVKISNSVSVSSNKIKELVKLNAKLVMEVASWKCVECQAADNKPGAIYCKHKTPAGRGSTIGSVSAWHASGTEFDPHVRHILSWRLGPEKNSTAILSLPLIQEEQLSVTDERMCTKYW